MVSVDRGRLAPLERDPGILHWRDGLSSRATFCLSRSSLTGRTGELHYCGLLMTHEQALKRRGNGSLWLIRTAVWGLNSPWRHLGSADQKRLKATALSSWCSGEGGQSRPEWAPPGLQPFSPPSFASILTAPSCNLLMHLFLTKRI